MFINDCNERLRRHNKCCERIDIMFQQYQVSIYVALLICRYQVFRVQHSSDIVGSWRKKELAAEFLTCRKQIQHLYYLLFCLKAFSFLKAIICIVAPSISWSMLEVCRLKVYHICIILFFKIILLLFVISTFISGH